MTKEYFTVEEVNELIPQLEYHFRKLLYHKREMARASNKLRKWGETPQLIGRVPRQARPEIQALQAEMRSHYREFKQHLFAMENLGGDIKDLELGRVEFPSLRDRDPVLLVWQLGVTDAAVILSGEERKKSIRYREVAPVFLSPPNSPSYQ